jgi:hypothetical protein
VYGTIFVDSAIACLNAVVQDAMEHAVPRGIINSNSKFPHWYSSSLRYYIRKKNIFTDLKKTNPVFTKIFFHVCYYLYLQCAVSVIGLVAVDSAHK